MYELIEDDTLSSHCYFNLKADTRRTSKFTYLTINILVQEY